MPDPLLPPDDNDPPPPPPPSPEPRTRADRPARIECGFCACTLVAFSGDVLKMSDTAKGYRDHADELETLRAKIAALESQITTLTTERDDARGQRTPKRAGIFAS